MKQSFAINDNWLFSRGFDDACLEPDCDFAQFYPVTLPHNAADPDAYLGDATRDSVFTYARVLTIPEVFSGKRLLLRFEGVLSYAEVYVNGTFVASHRGKTPFEADITAPVKTQGENWLVVKIDATPEPNADVVGRTLPCYAGIHRDVFFWVLSGRDIRDVAVRTPMVSKAESTVEVAVRLYDFYPETSVHAVIFSDDGTEVAELPEKTVQGQEVLLRGSVANVLAWSVDNPVRYTVKTQLKSGKKVLCESTVLFGFVQAVFQRDGFYLNGKRTRLVGLCRYDSFPYAGRAVPEFLQRADARLIRHTLACNCVRTLGLASKDFVDECSKIGLMVIADVDDGPFAPTTLIGTVSETVLRDRSEPSVIAWGIRPDGASDNDSLYFKTAKAAADLDGTRATFCARKTLSGRVFADVLGYLDESGRKVEPTLFTPYLTAAHSGSVCPARPFDTPEIGLNAAKSHLRAISRAAVSGRMAGTIGLCLSDFAAAPGKDSGDGEHYWGVTDGFRNLKTAAYAYAAQGDEPFMALGGSLAKEAFTGEVYIFTNCDSVRLIRNGVLAGEFVPSDKLYPGLKHAPIVISDFVGDVPTSVDGLDGLGRMLLRRCVGSVSSSTQKQESKLTRLAAFLLKKRAHLTGDALAALVGKYSIGAGTYRFEGVKDGEVVSLLAPGHSAQKRLRLWGETTRVMCRKSFEMLRFSIAAEDENGNVLVGDFSPVTIKAVGSIALVGAETITLRGGSGGFFVRTLSEGTGKVTAVCAFGEQTVSVEVAYGTVERI